MRAYASLLTATLLASATCGASAQSMTVFGNADAVACYEASLAAVRINVSSFTDVRTCTKALEHGQLQLKDRVATYVNRGILYASLERNEKAARDYETAIRLDDNTPAAYLNRGNLLFIARQMNDAISHYTRALELELRQADVALLNRGMAREHIGQLSAARSDYEAALEITPEWSIALSKLERVQQKIAKASAEPGT